MIFCFARETKVAYGERTTGKDVWIVGFYFRNLVTSTSHFLSLGMCLHTSISSFFPVCNESLAFSA